MSDRLTPDHAAVPVADDALVCDPTLKFVRVTERRADGLVAFDFSIGWPELSVELLLPSAAFDAFCAAHRVRHLDDPLPPATTGRPEETDA